MKLNTNLQSTVCGVNYKKTVLSLFPCNAGAQYNPVIVIVV